MSCSGDDAPSDRTLEIEPEIVDHTPNPCGGIRDLVWEDAAASPGDACGECDDGELACAGTEALDCLGASALNACRGCEPIVGRPGRSCGHCGAGAWTCTETGGIECVGDKDPNACGGCGVLEDTPGEACFSSEGSAFWACSSPEDLACVPVDSNACGGTESLGDRRPGQLCGTCDRSVLVCDGKDALTCLSEDAGVNACGGCSALLAAPGGACGECGGVWECTDEGTLACSRPRNACGACGELDGVPGASCDGGILACDRTRGVSCHTEDGVNACGGTEDLDDAPGESCGPCEDGLVVCQSPDTVHCIHPTARNACQGCGVLAGSPGATCAPHAMFVCEGDTLSCSQEGNINVCGGSSPLENVLGEPCGLCDSGTWACDGPHATHCEGEDPPQMHMQWADMDGDGHGDPLSTPSVLCGDVDGFAPNNGDCDDDDARFNPDADEDACVDAEDYNCDGHIALADDDGDGVNNCTDCDDTNPNIHPDAPELCDGVDNDCDDAIDEVPALTWYQDSDGDGAGDPDSAQESCSQPEGYVGNADDCDDTSAEMNPNASEVCDLEDNDCDGEVDEHITETLVYYPDVDHDGYGDPTGTPRVGCLFEGGWVLDRTDCDDSHGNIHPEREERCDGLDNNCNGQVDEDAIDATPRWQDSDGDGYGAGESARTCDTAGTVSNGDDCNDARSDTHPGAFEIVGDGVDQDCDGEEACYIDADNDGFVGAFDRTVTTDNLACSGPIDCPDFQRPAPGETRCHLNDGGQQFLDCDDRNAAIHPGANEIVGDAIDQNCDGHEICYRDNDGDLFITSRAAVVISDDSDCVDPGELGASAVGTEFDCSDDDASINPSANEVVGDGIDSDCDGFERCYVDRDMDGERGTEIPHPTSADFSCPTAAGLAPLSAPQDCDDGAANQMEVPGDHHDNDCDGMVLCYVDGDNDQFRTTATVLAPVNGDEMNACANAGHREASAPIESAACDGDPNAHPHSIDEAGDGVDTNCDGRDGHYTDVPPGYHADRYVSAGDVSGLKQAIADCNNVGCAVLVQAGEFSLGLDYVVSGALRLHGSYDVNFLGRTATREYGLSQWQSSGGQVTKLNGTLAIYKPNDSQALFLSRVHLVSSPAESIGGSAVGLSVLSSRNVTIQDSFIQAGPGSNGDNGRATGGPTQQCSSCSVCPTAAGSNTPPRFPRIYQSSKVLHLGLERNGSGQSLGPCYPRPVTGGQNGGASVGLLAYASNITLDHTTIFHDRGGAGGRGGDGFDSGGLRVATPGAGGNGGASVGIAADSTPLSYIPNNGTYLGRFVHRYAGGAAQGGAAGNTVNCKGVNLPADNGQLGLVETTRTTFPSGGSPPPPRCVAVSERCDGQDNDCDGRVDEDKVCGNYIQSHCRVYIGWADSNRSPGTPSDSWARCPTQVDDYGRTYVRCGSGINGQWARVPTHGDVDGNDQLGVAMHCDDAVDPCMARRIQDACRLNIGWADSNGGPADGASSWGDCPGHASDNDGLERCAKAEADRKFRKFSMTGDVDENDRIGVSWTCYNHPEYEESAELFFAQGDCSLEPGFGATRWGVCPDSYTSGNTSDACNPAGARCVGTRGDGKFRAVTLHGNVDEDDWFGLMLKAAR